VEDDAMRFLISIIAASLCGALSVGCSTDDPVETWSQEQIEPATEREADRRGLDPIDRAIAGEYAERRGELQFEAGGGNVDRQQVADDAIQAATGE
jgi:hypothetical protein